ncbi:DNA repair photolyase [Streptosporangium becharense]|uniref:DNA repair photolyase n=1 Tax=Streptosporangium becharense TaxID=1816182 RepID=A0A7W9MK29_9ACTN|nr:radical SAM protein [Streptosporangium becharense]MBB2914278.1 DNA repair photolyase [Streptosporangium becharense]MBB5823690.1 DNA repair photolyase [Streptosporangium becharense]
MPWDAPPLLAAPADVRPRVERSAVTRVHGALTCYEVQARTALEHTHDGWAVSPYRGCAQACRYCAVRRGHRYLGLDAETDFDSRIVVRTNIARRLRAELTTRWDGEHVTVGVGGDCYQGAEEIYRLMPGVVTALREAGAPFTVHTKSRLILRDADLLAATPGTGVVVSVAFVDDRIRRTVEPGAHSAQRRLELVAELNERGVPCGVAMAPILPLLTDSPDQLAATVRRIADAGSVSLTPHVLRLPPGAREWYLAWLGEHHPGLVARYTELYGHGPDADPGYVGRITGQVLQLAARYGMGATRPEQPLPLALPRQAQLTLL